MKNFIIFSACALCLLIASPALATEDFPNINEQLVAFRTSEISGPFFKNCYGYAFFPTVGKGGIGIGGAYGKGQVYRDGKVTGTASLYKLSIGFQLGGQAFSELIFFQDKRAYDEFINGSFELDASASAVVITAGAQATASTGGASAGLTAGPKTDKQLAGEYVNGSVIFVHTKGGLMYEATIGGQKFKFRPLPR